MLANDVVIQEQTCNLRCSYCLTEQSSCCEPRRGGATLQGHRRASFHRGNAVGDHLRQIFKVTAEQFGIPLLKVSGGEIFLIEGIVELIETAASMFSTVVVQTNGSLVADEHLAAIRQLPNVCLQVSLDGTRFEPNSYRSRNPKTHAALFGRIQRILESGIPTEIYCVLTDRSLWGLECTLIDLQDYGDAVMFFPFPVRGPNCRDFWPSSEQWHVLETILDNYDSFGSILPPQSYWRELVRFYQEGTRTTPCHLPRLALSTFDDGVVTSCPNIWFDNAANMLCQPSAECRQRLEASLFRSLLLEGRHRLDACRHCFTPWDMLSLFIEGQVTADELSRIPMYRQPKVQARIKQIAVARKDEAPQC